MRRLSRKQLQGSAGLAGIFSKGDLRMNRGVLGLGFRVFGSRVLGGSHNKNNTKKSNKTYIRKKTRQQQRRSMQSGMHTGLEESQVPDGLGLTEP